MHIFRYLGLAAPIVAFISIGVSIVLSPGFSFADNALSDLGIWGDHGIIFNFGLFLAGLMVSIFSISFSLKATGGRRFLSFSSFFVGIFLSCVGIFNESFGRIHFLFSVLFFVSLGFVILLSAFLLFREGKRRLSLLFLILFGIAAGSWYLPIGGIVKNVAIPEMISALSGSIWIVWFSCSKT